MHRLMRYSVVALMLVLAALPCAASPIVGPETRICPVFDAAPGNQDSIEIAAGANGYLAVWRDTRGGQSDIFACRLDASGAIMDPAAIPICQNQSEQTDPAVAWNGTEYLVVWGDRRLGAQHIYGARVTADGVVIDPQGICLSGTAGSQAYPRVASNGRNWQVVWQDSRGGSLDIYGVSLAGNGILSRVTGIVTQPGSNEETPDITHNGATYIVVWRDYRNIASTDADIYGCRVANNGIRMTGDYLISCDSTGVSGSPRMQSAPRVCSLGSNCMVVWEDYRGDGTTCDIYGSRITSTGIVLDRNGIVIASGTGDQELPAVAFDGNRILAVWRERSTRNVRGARISTAGSVLDPAGVTIYNGSAGSSGLGICRRLTGGFIVGWNNLSLAGNDTFIAGVPASGLVTPSTGTVVSLGQKCQSDYSVADNGSEYAVVWSQDVGGKECIMGARVAYDGTVLTTTAINITGFVYSGNQSQPSIAWNGSHYLLVWCGNETYQETNLDIRGLRLNAGLTPLDPAPIAICTAVDIQQAPCVTSNGSGFLVVWQDSRNALAPYYFTDIYGAIVSATGSVTAVSGAISMYTGNQAKPRAASDGTDYFVVWEDYRFGYPLIYGARVTSAGAPSPAVGIPMPATSTNQTNPFILHGGGNYLVTWSDGYRIAGCRVNSSGTVIDVSGINIDSGSTAKARPSTCWDGAGFQAVWEDYRSQLAGNSDVYYTTLSPTGVVSGDPKPGLVADLTPQTAPRVFGNSSDGVLFYTRVEGYINSLCVAPLAQQGAPTDVATISAAKLMAPGTNVCLRGKIVTAVFPGGFYAEEADRTSAIRAISTATVNVGDVVDVTGYLGIFDGERQIVTGTVQALGVASEPLRPFGIRGDMLGGAPLSSLVPGITGGRGANNLGLLVKTWGKVSSLGSGYFYLDCGAGTSVRVKSGGLVQPAVGAAVSVVGISTCDVTSGAICRAILPRTQADIVIAKPAN